MSWNVTPSGCGYSYCIVGAGEFEIARAFSKSFEWYEIPSKYTSRRHAILKFSSNYSYILGHNLETMNGTYVNGKQYKSNEIFKIYSGDIVCFGCNPEKHRDFDIKNYIEYKFIRNDDDEDEDSDDVICISDEEEVEDNNENEKRLAALDLYKLLTLDESSYNTDKADSVASRNIKKNNSVTIDISSDDEQEQPPSLHQNKSFKTAEDVIDDSHKKLTGRAKRKAVIENFKKFLDNMSDTDEEDIESIQHNKMKDIRNLLEPQSFIRNTNSVDKIIDFVTNNSETLSVNDTNNIINHQPAENLEPLVTIINNEEESNKTIADNTINKEKIQVESDLCIKEENINGNIIMKVRDVCNADNNAVDTYYHISPVNSKTAQPQPNRKEMITQMENRNLELSQTIHQKEDENTEPILNKTNLSINYIYKIQPDLDVSQTSSISKSLNLSPISSNTPTKAIMKAQIGEINLGAWQNTMKNLDYIDRRVLGNGYFQSNNNVEERHLESQQIVQQNNAVHIESILGTAGTTNEFLLENDMCVKVEPTMYTTLDLSSTISKPLSAIDEKIAKIEAKNLGQRQTVLLETDIVISRGRPKVQQMIVSPSHQQKHRGRKKKSGQDGIMRYIKQKVHFKSIRTAKDKLSSRQVNKLKNIAITNKTISNESDPYDCRVVNKPKVKLTYNNRGSFLLEEPMPTLLRKTNSNNNMQPGKKIKI